MNTCILSSSLITLILIPGNVLPGTVTTIFPEAALKQLRKINYTREITRRR